MEDFIINAFLGGIGVAILAGSMGSFVLWKKMSYFGDSLSHAALLGITLALFFNISPMVGAFILALIFALLLTALKKHYENDTILGILAHSGIAIAILILSIMDDVRVDLMGYLFGDILTITKEDIYIIYGYCLIEIIWLFIYWKSLILRCIDKNLAQIQNVNVKLLDLSFTIILSIIVVVSVKIVGILLITALLIIPSATARNLSSSPFQMTLLSIIFGILSVLLGIYSSMVANTPSGPSIIIAGLLLFIISLPFRRIS